MINRTIKKYSKKNKYKKNKYTKNKRNKGKNLKNKKIIRKGGTHDNENVICSMCESDIKKKILLYLEFVLMNMVEERTVYVLNVGGIMKLGLLERVLAMAVQVAKKKIPFTQMSPNVKKSQQPVEVIDLTED